MENEVTNKTGQIIERFFQLFLLFCFRRQTIDQPRNDRQSEHSSTTPYEPLAMEASFAKLASFPSNSALPLSFNVLMYCKTVSNMRSSIHSSLEPSPFLFLAGDPMMDFDLGRFAGEFPDDAVPVEVVEEVE